MMITFLVNLLIRAIIAQIGVIQINNKSNTPGNHGRLLIFLYKISLEIANKSNGLYHLKKQQSELRCYLLIKLN